ncbi:MAG: rhodanese-like domain-containing protein [Ignavibacteriales bacterium]|nr:rhodanese-like domain-containing protein [Ignavibacteriales bacterium]
MSLFSSFLSNKEDSLDIDNIYFEKICRQENVIVLDVRTKSENMKSRIPNSILIDIHEPDFSDRIDELERDKTYLVYCRSGVRSTNACQQMKKMGFENVFNLKNGIIKWHGQIEKG